MDMYENTRLIMPMAPIPQSIDLPRSQAGLRVSLEAYWQTYVNDLDFVYEWNDGYLEEKPVSKKETKNTFHWFVKVLNIYLEVYPIAEIYGLETAFELQLPHKTTVRRPDLGILKKDNPVPFKAKTDNYDGIFDLCIEALSDSNKSNIERDTIHKKEEYEEGGVAEYYILDAIGDNTYFYSMNQWGLYEEIKPTQGDIIVSQALPGFQFRISDLYRQPPLSELVKDEVYQGYVMLKYQAEKARAERERQEKERERQEKERERQEKERERAAKERERAEKERERARAQRAERLLIVERQEKEKERQRALEAEKEIQRLMALLQKQGLSPMG